MELLETLKKAIELDIRRKSLREAIHLMENDVEGISQERQELIIPIDYDLWSNNSKYVKIDEDIYLVRTYQNRGFSIEICNPEIL